MSDLVSEKLETTVKLPEQGYIDVDEHMETSIQGLFAIGDVRTKTLRQVVTAANDGAIAGQYAAKLVEEN